MIGLIGWSIVSGELGGERTYFGSRSLSLYTIVIVIMPENRILSNYPLLHVIFIGNGPEQGKIERAAQEHNAVFWFMFVVACFYFAHQRCVAQPATI